MNKYYLGIDIGKKNHVACLMNDKGEVLGKPLTFAATSVGKQQLETHLNNCIDHTDYPSVQVGFEATGHYWIGLYVQLKGMGFAVSVLNPLEVKAFRNEGIRGSKTDRIDAVKIAKLLRFGDYREAHVPSADLFSLRQLTRLRGDLVQMMGQLKQKSIAVLDQMFPEYQSLFCDTFGTTSTTLLSEANTPEAISALSTTKLTNLLRKASRGRFGKEKALDIQAAAKDTMGVSMGMDAFSLSLNILLSQIDHLQTQIDQLDQNIAGYAKKLNTTIATIPGIGPTLAGVILAEIGDFDRFISKDGGEKLVALAGLDPKLKTSGQFEGKTKMSKRGSPYLRHALRQASFIAVTVSKDPMFTKIYEKHIKKGKHMEVALSHVARKMVHVIYSLLKNKKSYAPII
jgi:transposase